MAEDKLAAVDADVHFGIGRCADMVGGEMRILGAVVGCVSHESLDFD